MNGRLSRLPGSAPRRAAAKAALSVLARNRPAAVGAIILALIVVIALLTPVLPLLPPDAIDPANRLIPPLNAGRTLGTDQLGRDMLARLLWGARLSLAVGLAATFVAALAGSSIGVCAGYFGRWIDALLMRAIDMLMAFPYVLLALTIVAALGPGLFNAMIAVAVVNIPFFARNLRGSTLGIVHREFIDAARLSGKGDFSILVSEVLPNVAPVIVITMSTTVGWMILETAGLSFLGLGSQPPQADLGSMLGEGRKLLLNAPFVSTIPGAVIFLLVIGVNLVGDGIRDALDPRLRSGAIARPSPVTAISRGRAAVDAGHSQGVLQVRTLSTEFQTAGETYKAVNSVSFAIRNGECLGLVGESGSGKSVTALSLLALVQSPPGTITEGAVLLDGEDVLSKSAAALRFIRGGRASYVFQDPQSTLHPLLTIGEQVAEALRAHQPVSRVKAWDKAVRLLDLVRIPNAKRRAHAFPHELSGGMRQRVGIAMALANHPEVLIADEPTTALDVTIQAQILDLMRRIRAETGTAIMLITHSLGVVAEMADAVVVMYAGRIVEQADVGTLFTDPQHPYTLGLLGSIPKLAAAEERLAAISGSVPNPHAMPAGCKFNPRCPIAEERCRAEEPPLVEIKPGHRAACWRTPLEHHVL